MTETGRRDANMKILHLRWKLEITKKCPDATAAKELLCNQIFTVKQLLPIAANCCNWWLFCLYYYYIIASEKEGPVDVAPSCAPFQQSRTHEFRVLTLAPRRPSCLLGVIPPSPLPFAFCILFCTWVLRFVWQLLPPLPIPLGRSCRCRQMSWHIPIP